MFEFVPENQSLKNKTILVTGAGDGIGKAAALAYAQHGATVILLGKTTKKLEAVYDEIVKAGFPEPAIIPLDMRGATKRHYQDMALTIEQTFGRLDGLLHNAGKLGVLSPFTQIDEQSWNDVLHVNVTAQFLMTQALIPVMKKAESASLVFTSSGVGNKGRAYWGPYSVSKFATEGMMEVIADEYDDSTIRVNAINPGGTNTAMRSRAFPAEDKSLLPTPDDIMPLYLYLMDDASADVHGQVINAQQ